MFIYNGKIICNNADVAESADALDSGSSVSNDLWVQVPSSAPNAIGKPFFLSHFFIALDLMRWIFS